MELELFKVKILGLVHARISVRCWPGQTIIQQLNHLESNFEDSQVCSASLQCKCGSSPRCGDARDIGT